MPTMLTLGVRPRRDPEALFAGLLVHTAGADMTEPAPGPFVGPMCVPMSAVTEGVLTERVLVRLDAAPPEPPPQVRAFVVDVVADQLRDALALVPESDLVVVCADGDVVETTALIDGAGRHPGLDSSWPEDRVADLLAVLAHAEHGFFAVADDADAVVSVLAGTVAALRGDDVRSALRAPDLSALIALHPDAAAATRGVLLGILVPDAPGIADELSRRITEIRDADRGDA